MSWLRPLPCPSPQVQLWWIDLDTTIPLDDWLGPNDWARAKRLAFPDLRRRFLVGRAALWWGAATLGASVERGPWGQPLIAGGALSLTRAGGVGLLALSEVPLALGVDAEPLSRTSQAAEIRTRIAAPGEAGDALWLWCRKEAALKAWGVGLSIEPRTIQVGEAWVRPPEGSPPLQLVDLSVSGLCAALAFGNP